MVSEYQFRAISSTKKPWLLALNCMQYQLVTGVLPWNERTQSPICVQCTFKGFPVGRGIPFQKYAKCWHLIWSSIRNKSLNTDTPKAFFSNSWKKKQNCLPEYCQWKTPKLERELNHMPDALCLLGRLQLPSTQPKKEPSSSNTVSFNLRLGKTKLHSLGLDLSLRKPQSFWAHHHNCPSQTNQSPPPSFWC